MKRTSLVFVTTLLVVFLMFDSTKVLAAFEELVHPVTTCTLTSASGNTGGQVTLSRPDAFTWVYTFTGISSRTNQISLICPVCDPQVDFRVTGVSSYNLLNPGEAESASGMNYANFQYRVLRTAPVLLGANGTVTVVTYEGPDSLGVPSTVKVETDTRASSLLLKSGNTDYFCANLAAPACSGLASSSVTISGSIVTNSGATFEGITYDKFTQCVKDITSCSGHPCLKVSAEDLPFAHGNLKSASAPGQVCPALILEDDNPGGTTYYGSGSDWWRACSHGICGTTCCP